MIAPTTARICGNFAISSDLALDAAQRRVMDAKQRVHLTRCVFILPARVMYQNIVRRADLPGGLAAEGAHRRGQRKHPDWRDDRHVRILREINIDRRNRHCPAVHAVPSTPPEAERPFRPLCGAEFIDCRARPKRECGFSSRFILFFSDAAREAATKAPSVRHCAPVPRPAPRWGVCGRCCAMRVHSISKRSITYHSFHLDYAHTLPSAPPDFQSDFSPLRVDFSGAAVFSVFFAEIRIDRAHDL